MQQNSVVGGGGVKPDWVRRGISLIRHGIELVARFEPIRRALFEYYDQRSRRTMRLAPVHPFDHEYGIRTSGFLPGSVLRLGYPLNKASARVGYLGVQPSILRRVLDILPHNEDTTFLDLGCGKGRALVVASEFSFRSVIGIEISPELVKVADENARVIAQDLPDRRPITVVEGNVLDYALPDGDLIVFLFNPFEEGVITSLVTKIETALVDRASSIWVVYVNPVCGHIFDTSSMLSRIYAESMAYDPGEIGSVPHSSDAVIIWQDAKSAPVNAPDGVNRGIMVTTFGLRAELAD